MQKALTIRKWRERNIECKELKSQVYIYSDRFLILFSHSHSLSTLQWRIPVVMINIGEIEDCALLLCISKNVSNQFQFDLVQQNLTSSSLLLTCIGRLKDLFTHTCVHVYSTLVLPYVGKGRPFLHPFWMS